MKKPTILGSVLTLLCVAAMSLGGDKPAAPARLSQTLPAAISGLANISNSQSESSQPLVGVDAAGYAYAVWYEHLSPRTFYFSTNKSGAWSAPSMIESLNWDTEESGWPIWAVAPNGASHLTFFDAKAYAPDDGLITYDVFDRAYENGTWGPTKNVTTNNIQNPSIYPGMAINPVDNYTYLVWSDHNGTYDRVIKSAYRKADGTWVPSPVPARRIERGRPPRRIRGHSEDRGRRPGNRPHGLGLHPRKKDLVLQEQDAPEQERLDDAHRHQGGRWQRMERAERRRRRCRQRLYLLDRRSGRLRRPLCARQQRRDRPLQGG